MGGHSHLGTIISTTGGFADIANAGWGGVASSTAARSRKWVNDPLPKLGRPSLKPAGAPRKEASYYDPYSPDNELRPGHWETSYEYNYVAGDLLGGDPQNTGFNMGKGAAFTDGQKKILSKVHDRISDKDCKDFINKLLADNHVAADRNTFDKLLSKADFNTYNEDATDTQLGVSMDGVISLRDAFNNAGAPAATFDGHVFFVELAFQRETTSLLPSFGTHNRNIDTATIAVHELLHVAGLKDPQVQGLNRQIHEHCGFTGMDY